MVIDTSALVAILEQEHDAAQFANAIEADPVRLLSAATVLEAGIVMTVRRGPPGGRALDQLLEATQAEIVPVSVEHARLAREAFARFGKGRNPAGLNFGDCFVYALAKASREPLLCKGYDFPKTDLALVELPSVG